MPSFGREQPPGKAKYLIQSRDLSKQAFHNNLQFLRQSNQKQISSTPTNMRHICGKSTIFRRVTRQKFRRVRNLKRLEFIQNSSQERERTKSTRLKKEKVSIFDQVRQSVNLNHAAAAAVSVSSSSAAVAVFAAIFFLENPRIKAPAIVPAIKATIYISGLPMVRTTKIPP